MANFFAKLFRGFSFDQAGRILEQAARNGERDKVNRVLQTYDNPKGIHKALKAAESGRWHVVVKDLQVALDKIMPNSGKSYGHTSRRAASVPKPKGTSQTFDPMESEEIDRVKELLQDRPDFMTITIKKDGENLEGRFNLSSKGKRYLVQYAHELQDSSSRLGPTSSNSQFGSERKHIQPPDQDSEARMLRVLCGSLAKYLDIPVKEIDETKMKQVIPILSNKSKNQLAKRVAEVGEEQAISEFHELWKERDRLNAVDENGETILMAAAQEGNFQLVEKLLIGGANVNIRSKDGRTALMAACKQGHLEVVRALVAKGGEINANCNEGLTPLSCACLDGHEKVVNFLLEKGVTVNSRMTGGFTTLMIATEFGSVEIVQALLAKGANVKDQNNFGETALDRAVEKGHIKITELLRDKFQPN